MTKCRRTDSETVSAASEARQSDVVKRPDQVYVPNDSLKPDYSRASSSGKISVQEGEEVDWAVESLQLSFRDVLINEDDIQYLAILGHGNGGTVYKANHKSSSKLMAVKVIPLDVTPEVQKQIMSELEILYRLVDSIAKTYVGTSAYMAPERILGDEYGIHSDVWSLGLSLLEIQKNKYYGDVVPMEVFQCILTEQHPFIQASGDGSDMEVIAMWMGQRRAQIDLLQQNPGAVARGP
ncbi:Dual specificity mitogen-activated protein kinase kinase 5 [Branchiostoma belcheri]|nr:Dual specificity mitogen-activated protein kinase kinase 5 [Branchiostoma belcheri]